MPSTAHGQIAEVEAELRASYWASVGNFVDAGADEQTVAIAREQFRRDLRTRATHFSGVNDEERDIFAALLLRVLEDDFMVNGAVSNPGPLFPATVHPTPQA